MNAEEKQQKQSLLFQKAEFRNCQEWNILTQRKEYQIFFKQSA